MFKRIWTVAGCLTTMTVDPAGAQVVADQVDAGLVTRSLPSIAHDNASSDTPVETTTTPPAVSRVTIGSQGVTVGSIVVTGADDIPASAFAAVTTAYLNRPLDHEELGRLAGLAAGIARARGLVFASASIAPQPLTDGVLTISLDEGRVDAVRSIGESNAAADRILGHLVTHKAVTKAQLERTILLVGDLPGIHVTNTSYIRQDGFGILLVTLNGDRAMVYAQIDNRGTSEIGRMRATALADLRGGLTAGDEIGVVAATTPEHPREFTFVSGRYSTPLAIDGGVVSITGYYGRTHAGGDLASLDLIGHSYGGAIDYSTPIQRSPRSNLWFDLEVRTLVSDQSVLGQRFREDDITVLTGTVRSTGSVGGGAYHANLAVSWGLPLPGMTHEGNPLASRPDGDARFVTSALQADWAHPITGPFSIALAGVAQLASRPLLATAEISLGGPAFGRAYDYSERTGDEGVLGSVELRMDLHRLHLPFLQRAQFYGFADGGVVTNLRDGFGGGSLASAGAGLRLGRGAFDGGLELAFPLNQDRFDTKDRSARLSAQLATHF